MPLHENAWHQNACDQASCLRRIVKSLNALDHERSSCASDGTFVQHSFYRRALFFSLPRQSRSSRSIFFRQRRREKRERENNNFSTRKWKVCCGTLMYLLKASCTSYDELGERKAFEKNIRSAIKKKRRR